jgi:xylan 1,4-beta-xylosidase
MTCNSVLRRVAVVLIVSLAPLVRAQQPAAPVEVHVDLGASLGPYRPAYNWFGYDESNYSTTPHGRELLGELHDLSPIPVYIRAHHLLTSGDGTPDLKWSSTNVYTEDANGHPLYDFHILDGIFDAYKAAGVRPMVELGFMPKHLAATLPDHPNQPYQVPFAKGDVLSGAANNPPKDYAKWGELARVVTEHLVQRYGRDEVLRWYFEVWNEPDIAYWHGSEADYLKLYDYAVAGVRSALPGARVGGPATTSPRNDRAYNYLKTFLNHVATGHSAANGGPIPLDFITFHAKGQPTFEAGSVTMGINRELQDVDRGFALVSSFPKFSTLPIILSEADPEGCAACSAKTNPANNYRNGTLYPAYTAAAYKRLLTLAAEHKVNLLGMLSWSFEFENKEYFEGFRSLATNGIDKPVLNVFRMLGMMHGTRVAATSTGEIPLQTMLSIGARNSDIDALATTTASGASILLWNYHDSAGPGQPSPIKLQVDGLPTTIHRAQLHHFRIDDTHSNAYTVWKAMGSPQHPTDEQIAQLKRAAGLQLLTPPQQVDVDHGTVTIATSMPLESISLIKLSW